MKSAFLLLFFLYALFPAGALAGEGDYGRYFAPLPKAAVNPDNPLNKEKIELGKMLFFDPRLSKSGLISCNTCHSLATGGVDNLPTSIGHRWQRGARNAPTVLNAALHTSQFWDGRAKDVEEQAKGPILNPIEMAASEDLTVERIASIPAYVNLFKKAFKGEPEPLLTYGNIARAIAAFERTLLTPSRFDKFLEGKNDALSKDELMGLDTFVSKGCVACHNGVGIGGNTFQKFSYNEDPGRFNVTKNESDRSFFRVASLRNVILTYPYFHDGGVWKIEEAVRIMGEKQLNIKLTGEEINEITAFLKALTGDPQGITIPQLPPSTDKTPLPDLN